MTPGFFIVVVAMGYELSWDLFAAQRTAAQLRRSEAELQASGERFRAVVEAAPNAMLLVDGRGQISLANAQAESLFGLSRDVLVASAVERLVPERARASHEGHRRGFAAELRPRAMGSGRDTHALRSDGSEVPVEVFLTPMHGAEPSMVLVSLIDISERRLNERRAARQRDEIAHLSRVAMLGELSGSLAHELNQPLAAILSNAQAAQLLLARDPPQIETVTEILADIVTSDQRAGAVIERLRSMLRKEDMKHALLDLNHVAEESLRLMHSDLLNRRVRVDTCFAQNLPPVSGDQVQLQQVMLNLLINGCDAVAGRGRRSAPARRFPSDGARLGRYRHLGQRRRHRAAGHRANIRTLRHQQAPRHRPGPGHLPVDHRGARRPPVGEQQRAMRRDDGIRAAGRTHRKRA